MYRQPMTSSVPGRSTVNVKPVRSVKSRACLSKSRRLASSDMPSTGGQPQDSKPGVARMWAMLDVHAAWSDSLCSTPSGTRCSPGRRSSRGGSKSAGMKPAELIARRYRVSRDRQCGSFGDTPPARIHGTATGQAAPEEAHADDHDARGDGDLLQGLGVGRTDRLQPWLAALG